MCVCTCVFVCMCARSRVHVCVCMCAYAFACDVPANMPRTCSRSGAPINKPNSSISTHHPVCMHVHGTQTVKPSRMIFFCLQRSCYGFNSVAVVLAGTVSAFFFSLNAYVHVHIFKSSFASALTHQHPLITTISSIDGSQLKSGFGTKRSWTRCCIHSPWRLW